MAEILMEKGYGIIPPPQYLSDLEEEFWAKWQRVQAFTMTSIERAYALFQAVQFVARNGIKGDFVECGVWKGGSCMLAALTLIEAGITDRKIFLYDTFEGMTQPGENDLIAWNQKSVVEKWESDVRGDSNYFTTWAVGIDEVKKNLVSTGYPEENLIFIKGSVDDTLTENLPKHISVLRLDTDWYESTRVELEHLYPLVSNSGVIIVDDYGHFTGARKAVDEYFRSSDKPILLNRIDYTGRIGIKN